MACFTGLLGVPDCESFETKELLDLIDLVVPIRLLADILVQRDPPKARQFERVDSLFHVSLRA
jgi:hypothetical protein